MTWSLESWIVRSADGQVGYPFGEEALGQLVYTAEGRMSVHLMRSDRDPDRFADMDGPTAIRTLRGTTYRVEG